ncbi:hypothetical protein R1X32_11890 [Rhodococcus opacus]|uniref:hypothetical protein n=1 Tax=Rhodococcus opacus TaxID=37919 RepID=UPI0034D1EED1
MIDVVVHPVAVISGLLLMWLVLVVVLWVGKPDELGIRDALRLLRCGSSDQAVGRGRSAGQGASSSWCCCSDTCCGRSTWCPSSFPILGYADDAVIVAIALRSVTRRAGPVRDEKHWSGTSDGADGGTEPGRNPSPANHTVRGERSRRRRLRRTVSTTMPTATKGEDEPGDELVEFVQ